MVLGLVDAAPPTGGVKRPPFGPREAVVVQATPGDAVPSMDGNLIASTTHIGLVADTGANGLAGRRRQTQKYWAGAGGPAGGRREAGGVARELVGGVKW